MSTRKDVFNVTSSINCQTKEVEQLDSREKKRLVKMEFNPVANGPYRFIGAYS